MKIRKFFNKLSLLGLVAALTFLPGCNGAAQAFKEQVTSNSTTQVNQNVTEDKNVTQGESEIHFIDTGNSDAILIINNGEAMLIDGAENEDGEFIVSYLKSHGITELEYIISTHAHADHVGGLDTVVENIHINTVFVANGDADTKVYRDFINAVMDKGLTPSVPLEDSQFPLGGGYFRVMNTDGGSDTNNESLVVEYINGEDKVILMGDAEEEVEKEILSKVEEVDLLKVGHHGSRTSTSQAFLEKINPTYAVITCGEGNKYGHPHQETLDKLKGIEVHRTDKCGSIVFKSTGHGITTDCENGTVGTKKKEEKQNVIEQTETKKDSITVSNTASNGDSTSKEDTSNKDAANVKDTTPDKGEVVYWTPSGKSYHKTEDCQALSRSKTILSGTLEESGKDDPCDHCYK